MAGPNLTRYGDIPISAFAGWDRVWQIDSVLQQHDFGQLRNSAILMDAMERDDRISGVLSTRVGGLMAAPIETKPANAKVKAARVAREIGGDDSTPGILHQIAPPAVVGSLSRWGTTLGIAVGELIWKTTADRWTPRLKVWHPQFLYWDWTRGTFMLSTMSGMIPLPIIDENPRSDGKWFVWAPYGFQYGWLRGIVRSLAHKYLMRQWNYRDWARYNERYGKPIVGGIMPAAANADSKRRFEDEVVGMGDDAVIMLPQGTDPGTQYDLKLIEAKSRGYQTFDDFKKHLDADIAIAVLGQDLPSESGGGGLGASKGSDIRDHVRIDKRIQDAAIWDAIRDQVLTWDARYNNGDPELAARPEAQVIPEETETEENNGMLLLGQALTALDAGAKDADGISLIDVEAVIERQGLPMLSVEERAAIKEQRAVDAADRLQKQQNAATGGGGFVPGGHEPGGGAPPFGGDPHSHNDAHRPTDVAGEAAQLTAGPGPTKRYTFQDLPIAVENEAGTIRIWQDGPRNIGTTTMLHDYGYIEGVMGSDGEEVDCYVGPDESAADVHVVHQKKAPDFKVHDEDKCFLGFSSPDTAKAAFLAHRNDEGAFGGMSTIPVDEFKRKLKRRTGTGKIRANLIDIATTEAAIMGLISRATSAIPAATLRSMPAKRRAKLYGDVVADRAKNAAARALAPDLAAIQKVIEASTDYADLRKRLPAALKGMRPEVIAKITEKARLMAHIGGRLAAAKTL